MKLQSGSLPGRIGRFPILALIGKGSHGIVYLARDAILDRHVAIKVLRQASQSAEQLQYYLGEGRHVARLRHPNIVSVFEAGAVDRHAYLVFEYVQGRTLRDMLCEPGSISRKQAMTIAHQVLAAMAHAHSRSVMHLDLSPGNIMIDGQGQARIMDFGLSRHGAGQFHSNGYVHGTPRYLSPEHLTNGNRTMRSEVFTLGLILYELLVGEPLIDGESLEEIFDRTVAADFDLRKLTRKQVRPALQAVIARALCADPGMRYAHAADMLEAFTAACVEAEKTPEDGHSTIEFLLRRMRMSQDFPALSSNLMTINRMTAGGSNTSAGKLADVILRDYSVTNKLLKLANSSFYGNFKGTVNSVSRAIAILGFDQVRMACNSLILFDSMKNKEHVPYLTDSQIHSFVSGLIARHLSLSFDHIDAEEAFICGMFHNLGRMLTIFYFPEDYEHVLRIAGQQGVTEEAAAEAVLGISLSRIGQAVAREWGFPETIITTMVPLTPETIRQNEAGDSIDPLRRIASIAIHLSAVGRSLDVSTGQPLAPVLVLARPLLRLDSAAAVALLTAALNRFDELAPILGLASGNSQYLARTRAWLTTSEQAEDQAA